MSLRRDIDTGTERIGEAVASELPEDEEEASGRIDAIVADLEDATAELRASIHEHLPFGRRPNEPPRASD